MTDALKVQPRTLMGPGPSDVHPRGMDVTADAPGSQVGTWCGEPRAGTPSTERGWSRRAGIGASAAKAVLRYDVAGGFDYVEPA